jgi:superfamily I DNA/RNA helicase
MLVQAIYGPPGTGKTTELLRRVKEARDSGVQAERVAFVSFTRAAASEALSRLGLKKSNNVSTIHAMAFRHLGLRQSQVIDSMKLREFATVMGVPIIGKSPEDDEERAEKLYETIRSGGVKVSNDYDGEVNEVAESEY